MPSSHSLVTAGAAANGRGKREVVLAQVGKFVGRRREAVNQWLQNGMCSW